MLILDIKASRFYIRRRNSFIKQAMWAQKAVKFFLNLKRLAVNPPVGGGIFTTTGRKQ